MVILYMSKSVHSDIDGKMQRGKWNEESNKEPNEEEKG
jgi:hypothetical protein